MSASLPRSLMMQENVAKLAPITDVAAVRIPALNWQVPNVEGKK